MYLDFIHSAFFFKWENSAHLYSKLLLIMTYFYHSHEYSHHLFWISLVLWLGCFLHPCFFTVLNIFFFLLYIIKFHFWGWPGGDKFFQFFACLRNYLFHHHLWMRASLSKVFWVGNLFFFSFRTWNFIFLLLPLEFLLKTMINMMGEPLKWSGISLLHILW